MLINRSAVKAYLKAHGKQLEHEAYAVLDSVLQDQLDDLIKQARMYTRIRAKHLRWLIK